MLFLHCGKCNWVAEKSGVLTGVLEVGKFV